MKTNRDIRIYVVNSSYAGQLLMDLGYTVTNEPDEATCFVIDDTIDDYDPYAQYVQRALAYTTTANKEICLSQEGYLVM